MSINNKEHLHVGQKRRNSVFVSNNKSSKDGLKWAHLFNQTSLETIPEDASSLGSFKQPRHSKISLGSRQQSIDVASYDKIQLPEKVDISVIVDVLHLNNACVNELDKLESYNFNIFNLRE